jgi:myo-inositol 2-dehydrogenase/D-chiro-inositol 1-dehydrogenase
MIGCEHGRRIAHVLSDADVVAVTDAYPDAAKQLAAELPNAAVRATGEELIADETVDAVVITSPASAHEEYAIAAIESGKPVFCEKPLASGERACRTIMAAEVATGRRLLQVGFMRRYDPAYRALKQTLDDGAIGRPLIYHSTHRTTAAPQTWSGDMAIIDAAVHDFDISRWLLGEEFTTIQVRAGKQNSHELRDPLVLILDTTSGVVVVVETSLNLGYGYDIRGEVVGEFGTAALADPGRALVRSARVRDLGTPRGWQERFADAYDIELQAWIDAVRAGEGATGPSAWDGYVAQVVSEAGITALHSGEPVAVELIEAPGIYE